jgi:hypothetical protein
MFHGYLVYIFYFGMLYQEKSGNFRWRENKPKAFLGDRNRNEVGWGAAMVEW